MTVISAAKTAILVRLGGVVMSVHPSHTWRTVVILLLVLMGELALVALTLSAYWLWQAWRKRRAKQAGRGGRERGGSGQRHGLV